MTALFIDTSYNQILGFLSDEGTWIDSKIYEGQKLTGVIHQDLDVLLKKNSKKLSEISKVIYCAGPGFYTGLRVSFGIADILRLYSIPVLSLYNYLIPQLCGIRDYVWITKAYRGEIFVYESQEAKISLVEEKKFQNNYQGLEAFTHSKTSIDENMRNHFAEIRFTEDLLMSDPQSVFSKLKTEDELFYFRPLDEEYKPSI